MDSSNPTSTAREDRTLVKLRELYLEELRRFIKTGEPGRRGVKLIIEYTESHPVATHRPDDRRTWVWSDLHLRHANIIKYCIRPFASAQDMDRALMACVSPWSLVT